MNTKPMGRLQEQADAILRGLRSPTNKECRQALVESGMNPITAATQAALWMRNNAHRFAERNAEAAQRNQEMIQEIKDSVKNIASKYEQLQTVSDFLKGH